ncbi:MAG: hypothetical protein ACOC9S_01850, partial [Planctomycetota bacterium]
MLSVSAAAVTLAALSAEARAEPTSRAATEPATATRPTDTQPTATQPSTARSGDAGSDASGATPDRNSKRRSLYEDDDSPDTGTGFADTREMLWKMMASLMVLGVLAVAAWIVFRKLLPRIG